MSSAADNVFVKSDKSSLENADVIKGYNFDNGLNYSNLFNSYVSTGYQASSLGQAIDVVRNMLKWRLANEEITPQYRFENYDTEPHLLLEKVRSSLRPTIFLGYTSNLISSGLREIFCYLAKHKMIDCIVTTCGGIEEDFIKCLGKTYSGDWYINGKELRDKGINRIGNLLVPNDNYCLFEDFVMPIFDQMLLEQNNNNINWTPSKLINRLGKEINDEESVYYWCYKNNIPVFCPAITDGSIGDMLYFHSYKNPGLKVDVIEDIRRMNNLAIYSEKTGAIVLGGGVPKHHIFNANLFRNGLDYVTVISTAAEFDGSDGGARLDESVSWGKVKADAFKCKVFCDATIAFPILVGETFCKLEEELKGSYGIYTEE